MGNSIQTHFSGLQTDRHGNKTKVFTYRSGSARRVETLVMEKWITLLLFHFIVVINLVSITMKIRLPDCSNCVKGQK